VPRPLLRVVVDGRAPGAWNMAVDDALLRRPGSGWTLRFYGWDRPTVSLGYAQPLRGAVDEALARRLGIPLVRRPTGGRAVLHADEITYAITAPADQGPLAGAVSAAYRRIAAGLQTGFGRLGATVDVERAGAAPSPAHKGACFSARTRYELSAGGRKLAGSAQRRRDGRLLQHGSLLLGRPDARLWAALGEGYEEALDASLGLDELMPARPARRVLVAALSHGIADALGLPLRATRLSTAERRAARRRYATYRDPAWTRRR
jgi:lipoate-protein ligase A